MKKIVSVMLVLLMMVVTAFPSVNTAFATGNGTESTLFDPGEHEEASLSDTSKVEEVARLFMALPSVDELADLEDDELEAVAVALADAVDAYSALSGEDAALFEMKYAELYQAVVEELYPAMMGTAGDAPSLFSMRPIEETEDVYITLSGYTQEQLQNFSVDTFVGSMTKDDGTPISIDKEATSAWLYYLGDEYEEYHTLNNGETIDLWDYNRSGSQYFSFSYTFVLVLGKGKQLDDANNHRYIVRAEIRSSTEISSSLSYSLRRQRDGNYYETLSENTYYAVQKEDPAFVDTLNMSGLVVEYHVENNSSSSNYSFRVNDSEINTLNRRGVSVEVYPVEKYLAYRDDGKDLTGAITDQIFGDGYKTEYTNTEVKADAPNLFCVVFSDASTGEEYGYFGMLVTVQTDEKLTHKFGGNLGHYDGQGMSNVLDDYYRTFTPSTEYVPFTLDPSNEENPFTAYFSTPSDWYIYFDYEEGEYSKEDFYFSIEPDVLDELKDVYVGSFYSEEEAIAENAESVKDTIVHSTDQSTIPYGYKVEPIHEDDEYYPTEFTIVLNDGTVFCCYVELYCYSASGNIVSNGSDPLFNIRGAYQLNGDSSNKVRLDTYVADEEQGLPLDTYYRLDTKYEVGGYQLLLINDSLTDEELKAIIPTFSVPSGVEVSSGEKVISGETSLQSAQWSEDIENTVMYQVSVPGEKVRNYQVTFAAKQAEATLFVAGPGKREVYLTADNQFVHDILIANIGGKDLTGLNVELTDAENVKLDSYWTVGGEGNDTLPAFTKTYTDSSFATLGNIAKVRLVPDGDGEIKGTLKITAAGGQEREIELTGIAENPRIVTKELAKAVKYVPYSYMVATNCMNSEITAHFEITNGTLPEGLSFYERTGEIYGVPQETGTFPITVKVTFNGSQFTPATATFDLVVEENSNENVFNQTSEGYSIEEFLGKEQGDGTYDFLLSNYRRDQLFVSSGEYGEFVALWLNGKRLEPEEDYTYESGSTRITIKGQTFVNKADKNGSNTIAAEFRVDGKRDNDLKTTAQNFRLSGSSGSSSSGSGSGSSGGGSALDRVPGSAGQTPGDTSGQTPGDTTGDTSGQTPGDASGNTPGQTPGDASGQTPGSSSGSGSGQTSVPAAPQGITLRFQILNQDGSPLANAPVELHSTPRTGTTDASGVVVFSDVEYGPHTFIVKTAAGEDLESLVFSLQEGSLSIDGSSFTAVDGTTLTIRTQLTDEGMAILNVTAPQTSSIVNQAGTAVLFVLAGALSASAAIMRRKRRSNAVKCSGSADTLR